MDTFDSQAYRDRVRQQIARLRATSRPVAEHFALVPSAYQEFAAEFIEPDQTRWLALPQGHHLTDNYQYIFDNKLPVLPAFQDDASKLLFMQVPLQTRSLLSIAQQIKQNPQAYSDVLLTIGRMLWRMSQVRPRKAPYDPVHSLLAQFALVSEKNVVEHPDIIFLAPPYTAIGIPQEQVIRYMQRELNGLGFSVEAINLISGLIYQGWQQAATETKPLDS